MTRVRTNGRTGNSFLVRSALAGLTGTAAMSATTWAEEKLRPGRDVGADYDATHHVVIAAATVLHRQPRTEQQARALFLLTHWGYGSAVAGLHSALLLAGMSRPRAAAVFYGLCQSMALLMFPTLGDTPVPWRWRRDVLVSSFAQHLVYVSAVSVVDARMSRTADLR